MATGFGATGVSAYKNMAAMEKNMSNMEKAMDTKASDESSFGDLIKEGLESTIEKGHTAEKMAIGAANGSVDLLDATKAIGEAEETLKTVVAIRDKALTAYQEVMRMAI